MRDRLIELLKQCSCHYSPPCTGECGECHNVEMFDKEIEHIADHLLAAGVIVPPCKVGDTVYVTDILDRQICECEVIAVIGFAGEENTHIEYKAPKEIPDVVSYECPDTEIGISIFLTREEAEKALAERRNENG